MKRSRQQAWQERQRKAGRCTQCGRKRDADSIRLCTKCLIANRLRNRAATGSKERRPGGPGRPSIGTAL